MEDDIIWAAESSTNVNPSNAPSREPKYAPRRSGVTDGDRKRNNIRENKTREYMKNTVRNKDDLA
jgi:hypothetical protein